MKKNHALDWKKVFNISLLCLSFGMIIYFCVKDNNLAILIQSFSSLNFFWLIPAVLLIAGVWALEALLYHLIVNSVYPGQYSWKEAVRVTMVGQYFSAVTPFGVAGQPMQLVALSRQGVSSGVAVSVVVRKFLIYQTTLSLYSLGVILLKSSFFESQIHGFLPLALVGFLAQAASVLLLFLFSVSRTFTTKLIQFFFWLLSKLRLVKRPEEKSKRVHAQLESYLNNNKSMNHNWKLSLQLYGLTFLELTVLFSVPFFLYKAYHNPGAPYFDMVSAQAFVTMIAAYTPLPGAAGTSEGSFLVLFNLFFQGETVKQAMLLWRFITYYSTIVVGMFFARLGKKGPELARPEEASGLGQAPEGVSEASAKKGLVP